MEVGRTRAHCFRGLLGAEGKPGGGVPQNNGRASVAQGGPWRPRGSGWFPCKRFITQPGNVTDAERVGGEGRSDACACSAGVFFWGGGLRWVDFLLGDSLIIAFCLLCCGSLLIYLNAGCWRGWPPWFLPGFFIVSSECLVNVVYPLVSIDG